MNGTLRSLPVRLLRWSADTLRGWGWRQTALAALVAAATSIFGGVLVFEAPGLNRGLFVLHTWLCHLLQLGLPLVFTVGVADRAVDDGERPIVPYLAAAVVTVASSSFLLGPALIDGLLKPVLRPLLLAALSWQDESGLIDLFGFRIYLATTLTVPVALCTVLWAHARQGWRAERKLRQRELDHARTAQTLASVRLLALEARVEPQLLFDVLRRADALIDSSVADANALLMDLAGLLRVMLPSTDATASTLAREFALLQAYGRVSGLERLQPPWLMLQADPALGSAAFAPLVLVPLARQLAALGPPRAWQFRARRQHGTLCITVGATGARASDVATALATLDLAPLRERLLEVHGHAAVLRDPDATRGELVIELENPDDGPSPDR